MKKVQKNKAFFTISDSLVPSFDSLPEFKGIIGQDQALKALEIGLNLKKKGFNIFVAGEPGTGRTSAVKSYLDSIASKLKTPPDLCFVNNFRDPYSPQPILMEAGKGKDFKEEFERGINSLIDFVRKLKDSKELKEAIEKFQKEYNEKHSHMIKRVEEIARRMGFALQPSPQGIAIIPMRNGKPLPPEEFAKLSPEEKEKISIERQKLEDKLGKLSEEKIALDRKFRERLEKVKRTVVEKHWKEEFTSLRKKFPRDNGILEFLNSAREDFLSSIEEIENAKEEAIDTIKRKYSINLAVDNSMTKGAPVIVENNPTYRNLIGSIEREPVYGTYITDFTMIKPGSLIKANGGFLIIHAEDLTNALVWRSLKKSLITESVQIEDLESLLNPISVKSIKPMPVPLDVKVILIGSYYHYNMFYNLDVEFREIFRIKAEFDWTMDLNKKNVEHTASFFKYYCQEHGLLSLNREAFKELLRYSSRIAGERDKISTNFGLLIEIISEADYYARKKKRREISPQDIKESIRAREFRSSLFKKKDREMFKKGLIKVETSGKKVGQINGLTYIKIDGLSFGRPIKITVSVGPGKEGIVDIEREAALSGPIHTKGVLILNGLLVNELAKEFPLTLSARLVFEQSYSEIDGDSASAAEYIAILSALSDYGIKQNFAVTGSINQKGEIQPIGGVNEKIEGFFEVCKIRNAKGKCGVVIPEDNIADLNLKDEVLEAMEKDKFEIYAVKNVRELAEFMMEEKFQNIKNRAGEKLKYFYSISKNE